MLNTIRKCEVAYQNFINMSSCTVLKQVSHSSNSHKRRHIPKGKTQFYPIIPSFVVEDIEGILVENNSIFLEDHVSWAAAKK